MEGETGTLIRVAVVEDDRGTAAMLSAFLSGLDGVRVVGTAGDGREGLALIRREEPDLVLLDLVMPEMDGLELLQELGEDGTAQAPYVIVLSGVSSDVTVQRALGLGADFYLVKPVNLAALSDRICDRFRTHMPAVEEDRAETLAHWYLKEMGGGSGPGPELVGAAAAALSREKDAPLKSAYADIRRRWGVEYANAERRIRRCILALHQRNTPAYRELLGEGRRERPPSNGEFLRLLAEKLRQGLQ